MKISKIIFGILLIHGLTISGCSSTKVVSDSDPNVDFTQLKTFQFAGWAENSDEALNRFDKERIESAFREEARKRGITPVEKDADLIAVLFVTGEVKTQQTAHTTHMNTGMGGMGMRRGMAAPGWGWGMGTSHTTINETQYLKGTLMLELYDPVKKQLIWQGVGTKTVNEDPKKREKGIPKKVTAIMKQYPVKPLK